MPTQSTLTVTVPQVTSHHCDQCGQDFPHFRLVKAKATASGGGRQKAVEEGVRKKIEKELATVAQARCPQCGRIPSADVPHLRKQNSRPLIVAAFVLCILGGLMILAGSQGLRHADPAVGFMWGFIKIGGVLAGIGLLCGYGAWWHCRVWKPNSDKAIGLFLHGKPRTSVTPRGDAKLASMADFGGWGGKINDPEVADYIARQLVSEDPKAVRKALKHAAKLPSTPWAIRHVMPSLMTVIENYYATPPADDVPGYVNMLEKALLELTPMLGIFFSREGTTYDNMIFGEGEKGVRLRLNLKAYLDWWRENGEQYATQ